jgi:hypothetical protein
MVAAAVRDKVPESGFSDNTSAVNSFDYWCKPITGGDGLFARPNRVGVGEAARHAHKQSVGLVLGTMPANDLSGAHRLYVITLVSADVPMPLLVPFVHELVGFTVFRSRSVKYGRDRFRLHLGYFESEARAQEALSVVRRYYPAARIVSAPRSGLGSLDDTMNTEFRMIRGATARVVTREDFILPPVGTTTATDAVKPRLTKPPPATELQRYVVQLGWWTRPVDPMTTPRLPVFRAFDLYSVRIVREGTAYQGIRLGFFQNVDQAQRVAEHIRSHYPQVGVVPVSHREYARVVELIQQRTREAIDPARFRRS